MGSSKGLDKKLRDHAIALTVDKGSKPLTRDQINDYFKKAREAEKEKK